MGPARCIKTFLTDQIQKEQSGMQSHFHTGRRLPAIFIALTVGQDFVRALLAGMDLEYSQKRRQYGFTPTPNCFYPAKGDDGPARQFRQ